ncbi:MAG: segregation/condensation protein A [Gammaproteobacteria bacterium]|nr:segregation/condensation protein A [Gammaproteobacteria bacterium]
MELVDSPQAVVRGEPLQQWPTDLYIPPDALEVILEEFQGPLDLLLYLIRKQNLDILNIPVAEITQQYMEYVELMRRMRLDLAAEYLVMAAMLAEIKSRMLLPRDEEDEDEEDPRAALVRRLQEYERFRETALQIDQLPRVGREIYLAYAGFEDTEPVRVQPQVDLTQLADAFHRAVENLERNRHLMVSREVLSVRERMASILDKIKVTTFTRFEEFFDIGEGRMGLVVTFIAILELLKDGVVVVVQNEAFAPIHLKASA